MSDATSGTDAATLDDEQALFVSDAWPTGYVGADFCDIEDGDTVAVWGCGVRKSFALASQSEICDR